ncbi:gp53-like domain-containing protein [Morganella morganii]|uniref:gp53-like domain-containing protein n=1 Tax=Morganella morganii TaxID=582 RepID=UPI0032D9D2ED
MFGLDNKSGINVMPPMAPADSQTPLWFTEGGAGQSATYPGQEWFNQIQAELLNILKAADIAPQKGSLNQLSSAISRLASAYAVSIVHSTGQSLTSVMSQKAVTDLALAKADKDSFAAQNFSSAISAPELRVTDAAGAAAFNKVEGVAHKTAKGDWNFFNYPEKSGVGALLSDIPDAAKILELLLMVDGTGSGIDADYVRGLPADFSSLLSANGYQKLPSGLIVQWGVTEQTSAPLWTPYNIAFPNKCIFISIEDREGGQNLQLWQKNTVVNNGFSAHPICRIEAPGKFTGVTASAAPWIALGF